MELLAEWPKQMFASEHEEALWWEAHEVELFEEFKKVEANQEAGVGIESAHSTFPSIPVILSLDPNDIAAARVQAERRGLRYQTYLKMIIHEALLAEEQKVKSARG